jgi:plastocyanin
MSHRSLAGLAASTVLILAACSAASVAPSGAASVAAAVCHETTDAGAVAVSVVDFSFQPSDIAAKTGQAIAFTNAGAAAHTATLDGGQCATPLINPASSDGLVFSVAGTYKFHCSIHSQMTGTIVIS